LTRRPNAKTTPSAKPNRKPDHDRRALTRSAADRGHAVVGLLFYSPHHAFRRLYVRGRAHDRTNRAGSVGHQPPAFNPAVAPGRYQGDRCSQDHSGLHHRHRGRNAVMPAIRRLSDAPYRWDIVEAPLSEVANQEKLLPTEFISADGFGVTEAARRYLGRLSLAKLIRHIKDGLPDYVKLQNAAAPKKLAREIDV
jgi:hypothetical protein